MGTVAVVYLLSKRTKGSKTLGLVLFGASFISSLFFCGDLVYESSLPIRNEQLPAITYWLMGSLAGAPPFRMSPFR